MHWLYHFLHFVGNLPKGRFTSSRAHSQRVVGLGSELRHSSPRAFTPGPLCLRNLTLSSDLHRNRLSLTFTVVPGCGLVQDDGPRFGMMTPRSRGVDGAAPGLPARSRRAAPNLTRPGSFSVDRVAWALSACDHRSSRPWKRSRPS